LKFLFIIFLLIPFLLGQAAATKAGPAVVISFVIAGIAASFAALCYSELSSMIPVAGSAYTYVYATLGELAAWIIGWSLILEYAVGASTIAVGWSGYFVHFFEHFGIKLSPSWTSAPLVFDHTTGYLLRIPDAYINLPAFLLIISLTIILILGIKESAIVNNIAVTLKVFVILLFVIVGITKINPKNYDPFIPPNEGTFSQFGITGILSATSVVFFAYIGFDAISTTAQETKNPQRNLPIGIIASLVICTILYVAVCAVLTGIVHYSELNVPAPVTVAINAMGMGWLGVIVDFGALTGLISGILVSLMGQPRIFYSMAK
jgi:APA family basic amino acid/polyamine antiporter